MPIDADDAEEAPGPLDYFAEAYVAGRLAVAGWNVYFPRRDNGLDLIATKMVEGELVIRPVQVKGKYPTEEKTDKPTYGYIGRLTQTHPELVLAIPYFQGGDGSATCCFVAYMPFAMVKRTPKGSFRCEPALFRGGAAVQRRDHAPFFGPGGIKLLERPDWRSLTLATL
jgi:hypothetical protein